MAEGGESPSQFYAKSRRKMRKNLLFLCFTFVGDGLMCSPMVTSYFCPVRKASYEVLFSDVQPHWVCSKYASVRCEIGHWNFNRSFFVPVAVGHGNTHEQAFLSAVRDSKQKDVMNEDRQMLGC